MEGEAVSTKAKRGRRRKQRQRRRRAKLHARFCRIAWEAPCGKRGHGQWRAASEERRTVRELEPLRREARLHWSPAYRYRYRVEYHPQSGVPGTVARIMESIRNALAEDELGQRPDHSELEMQAGVKTSWIASYTTRGRYKTRRLVLKPSARE